MTATTAGPDARRAVPTTAAAESTALLSLTAVNRAAGYALIALALLLGPGLARAAGLPAAVDGEQLPSLAPMLERTTPAVVNIAARSRPQAPASPLLEDPFFRRFFNVPPRSREERNLGSGVVVDARRGLLLTNHHVIAGASEIRVTLRDGRQLDAELLGTDPDSDIAVLRVRPEGLSEVRQADSDRLRVGDFVVAIGNPFGLGQTVTSGIVSALGRSGLGIEGYEDFIQTDASINVGNSGGALVNLRGELVGINTAIFAPSGGSVGIGFAIPSNMALSIMRELVTHGRVRRGLLGVVARDLTPQLVSAFGVPDVRGALIEKVSQPSPAERAGLQPGDVVIAVNGKSIKDSAELGNAIGLARVGERLAISVLREGERVELSAELALRSAFGRSGADLHPLLAGAVLEEATGMTARGEQLTAVSVLEIDVGSAAWRAGLRRSDLIAAVNRRPVRSIAELAQQLQRIPGQAVLSVRRGSASLYVLLQ